MAVDILLVWSGLGGAFLSQRNAPRLAWLLCWKEEKESMECRSSLPWAVWKEKTRRVMLSFQIKC